MCRCWIDSRLPDFMAGLDVMAKWEFPIKWMHHNWSKAIEYAHVNPEEFCQMKSPPKSTKKTAVKRTQRIDNAALSPTRGPLSGRLTAAEHFALPCDKKQVCQLHCWAHRQFNPNGGQINPNGEDSAKPKGSRSSVVRCHECHIHLCIPCFEIYHMKQRLVLMVPTILGFDP